MKSTVPLCGRGKSKGVCP